MVYQINNPSQNTWYIFGNNYGIVKPSQQLTSGFSGTFETFTVLEDFLSRLIELNITLKEYLLDHLLDGQVIDENLKNQLLQE